MKEQVYNPETRTFEYRECGSASGAGTGDFTKQGRYVRSGSGKKRAVKSLKRRNRSLNAFKKSLFN